MDDNFKNQTDKLSLAYIAESESHALEDIYESNTSSSLSSTISTPVAVDMPQAYSPKTDLLHTIPMPKSNEYKVFWQQFRRACADGDKDYIQNLPPGWIEKIEEHTLLETVYATILYRHLDIFDMLVEIPKIRDNIYFAKTLKSALHTMCAYAKTGIPEKILSQFAREIDLEVEINLSFLASAKFGDMGLLRYVLHSHELPVPANIKMYGLNALIGACEHHHVEAIQYLTSSPELLEPVSLLESPSEILFSLCLYGSNQLTLEIMRYLFDSPLPPHNLPGNAIDESIVSMVIRNEDWSMLEYFIMSHNIENQTDLFDSPFSHRHRDKIQSILDIKKTRLEFERLIPVQNKTDNHNTIISKI